MHFLYNIGIRLMQGYVAVAALFSAKLRARHRGDAQAFDALERCRGERYVWFHAASLGEFEQARPMIERLRKQQPDRKILLTFFSPSGYEIRKNYACVDVVCYLPFDTPFNVRRFLDLVNPSQAIFVKYEFWANYLLELHRRQVPTYLISSIFREKQLFFKSYGGFFRSLLHCYTHIFVQDEASKQLLENAGVEHVTIGDDTRFDRVSDIAAAARQLPIAEAFARNSNVLVVGSSWEPDEDLLVRYINANQDICKMIIAPHVVSSKHIASLCEKLRCNFVLYTQTTPDEAAKAHCLVVDTIGVLSSLYQYGRVAYIGGGFGVGIHNTLEAAVWGMPVVFGPNYRKFREAHDLIACGGGFSIRSYRQLEDLVTALFNDHEAARHASDYVKQHVGATDKIFGMIFDN